jgi:RNA polymerase sigma-70 factor (ECF subfamily)
LYRLAHNYTIDWLRKNEKEQQTYAFSQLWGADEDSWHNFVENFVVSDENISNNTDSLIKRELLKGCLSELSGKYKDVVLLFYFEQKSYDEIAYIMDINLPHVWTLLLRAKQQLKTVIQATAWLKEALDFDL